VTSAYTFAYMLATECAYALMYVQFVHSALGNEEGGVQLVYEGTCCLAWGLFLREGEIRVLSVSSLSLTWVGVHVSVCVCTRTHTHTHCTCGVLGREPRGRDETPGGPEESRWTKSRHIYIRTCVQSTHLYVYARRRDEILD